MLSKNVETFIGCDSDYAEAKLVIFGAPFDSTTSFRPGTRFASKVMRSESFGIETYSPYQDKDLEDINIFDSGDIELCFGDVGKALDAIEERAEVILSDGKIPCMIGGEHLVTLGAIRAAARKYPDLHVIQFDAHADLRDDYLGQKLSHACVMRRAWELLGDGRIHQHGIRSGEKQEFIWATGHTSLYKFNLDAVENTIEDLKGKNVYLTVDMDVLDPSEFPGTGTPEAGGVSFNTLLSALIKLKDLNIVALDINELSPVYDTSGASTALACKLFRELLLTVSGGE